MIRSSNPNSLTYTDLNGFRLYNATFFSGEYYANIFFNWSVFHQIWLCVLSKTTVPLTNPMPVLKYKIIQNKI